MSHASFAAKQYLPYTLLTDEDGALRSAFDVPKSIGLIPGRVTFVIDKKGVVKYVHNSQLNPSSHIWGALEALKKLGK